VPDRFEVVIVGGGIAGISLAARLAGRASVAVLEAEEHLGAHATGRSAALLVEAYGPPEIRTLTGLSRAFFESPPPGFCEVPLARRRGGLIFAAAADLPRLQAEYALACESVAARWLSAAEVLAACPILRPGVAAAGFLEPDALDLDANALLQGFARQAAQDGVEVHKGVPIDAVEPTPEGWRITAGTRQLTAAVLVDAAGAWADAIAAHAGVDRLGLQPMRRTAATLPVPPDVEELLPQLPFAAPVDESFYFKPEARSLMVSLAEETPVDPGDAYPDDLDVAIALERFHEATTVPRARPNASWAGLRTFAPDRRPVVGFDPRRPGFFWCAGQGGYGIQTAPALSALAAKLLLGEPLSEAEAALAAALDPARLQAAG